jgi:tetratricopeptide (TPR) repeat protein
VSDSAGHFSLVNEARFCGMRKISLCACIALALIFSLPRISFAQTAELASISALMDQGKLQEAEQRLNRYLVKLPHSTKANTLLAEMYLRQNRFQRAEDILQKSIAWSPTSATLRVTLGDALLAQGKMDAAQKSYEAAIKIDPHDVRGNLALAKLYLGAGEYTRSIAAAENIPPEKRTTELLPTLAADYFGLQQPEKGALEVQGILQVADKQPDLIPELAEFFLAHGDFKSAEQVLALVQAKTPFTDRYQIDLARGQAGLGQLDEAQKTLEGVLERSPQSVDALVAAGQVASQQKDWTAAEQAFSVAADLAPGRADILSGLVSAELYGDNPKGALKTAQQLHALLPDDLRATYFLALAFVGAKDLQRAKPLAEQVLKIHPEDREMNLVLVDIAFNEEHNLPIAKKYVDICLKQNPNDPGALYYFGMIQKMDGDVAGATQSLAKSVAGNSQNADAQAALGALYLQSGNVSEAIHALEEAVALAPEQAQNHYQLAIAYSRSNATEKAKAQLDIYQQMKAKEVKEAKDSKGPSTSEVPYMGIGSRP